MVLAELSHSAARGAKQVKTTRIAGLVSLALFVCVVCNLVFGPRELMFGYIFCGIVVGLVALMLLWMSNAYRKRQGQRLLAVSTEGVTPGDLPLVPWSKLSGITVLRAPSARIRSRPTGVIASRMVASAGISDGIRQVQLSLANAANGSHLVDASAAASAAEFEAFVGVLTAEAAKHGVPVS